MSLRPPAAGDEEWIVRACADPEIPRWTTVPSPYREGHARAFIEDRTLDWDQGTAATFAILLAGEPSGMVDLVAKDSGAAEIGYWVAPWARRRSLATRASHLVVTWGFTVWGRTAIRLRTMPGNLASEGVAAALGFTRGPLVRDGCSQRGTFVDTTVWTRSEPPAPLG